MQSEAGVRPSRGSNPLWLLAVVGLLGVGIGFFAPFAFLLIAMAGVVLAIGNLERLSVAMFWTLPYMVVNLPTGVFTLKLPEVVAYLFATAVVARVMLRKERLVPPPATLVVLAYLVVLGLSAALSPPVPGPYQEGVSPFDRNAPDLRSLSLILWLGLSWLVVTALYNVVGKSPDLYWRCVRAHILAGGLAAFISLCIYILALRGIEITNVGGQGVARSLTPMAGTSFRLAGVAYEPLFLAFYLQTVLPVTVVALLTQARRIPMWQTGLCLFFQILALILTFSAGGWVSAFVAVALVIPAVHRRISRRAAIRLGLGALTLTVLVTVFLIVEQDSIRQASITLDKLSAGGDSFRQGEWEAGMRMFQDYPITGIGPGLSSYHFARYHPAMQSSPAALPEVNSLYLAVLAEAGILGFIALMGCGIALAGRLFRALWRHGAGTLPLLTGLTVSLIGCALQYSSLNSLFLIYFCALIGLALAGERVSEIAPGE